ncbi:hypothetical protein C7R54_06650 [Achromobacter aloeverae]|uniref:Uncharacterized protein n=1 Tax=Achromobacter aloeverae TaxID=1750518 RepID=A0A4Q1HSW5_9BURK|nr:hypothetical protein C7R54_06650 [Achromobacter aloeverae]
MVFPRPSDCSRLAMTRASIASPVRPAPENGPARGVTARVVAGSPGSSRHHRRRQAASGRARGAGRAGQDRTGQDRTGQDRTGQGQG